MMGYTKTINAILNNRPASHILYWIATVIISIIYGLGYGEPLALAIIFEKIALPTQLLATYLFIYIQLPLLYRKKYFIFFLSFLLSSYLFHILMHVSNDLWFGAEVISYHSNHNLEEILKSGEYYLTYSVDIYLVVFITAGIKLIKDNLQNKKKFEILEAEKAKKEYQYLQSRIQPQFLLNTLQLIENQSMSNNNLAAQSIADLSEVLDYSLYKSEKSEIALDEECRQLKLFSKLYSAHSKTIFKIQSNQSNLSIEIMIKPMRLIKLLESTLNYIEELNNSTKSVILETTSIEEKILLDIHISGVTEDIFKVSEFRSNLTNNLIKENLKINVFSTNHGCNLQIKLS